ncbi:diguanylate cyclase [Colidextribacter sp. OB.20]|uniref:sensor domain-containing diguanylate cyclase n=1 Tax=Colidextribacter sp. OB.20 TaxID=2304568 RepID=UPI001369E765|nr:diguanylate cyclase [Colidextribacter sp. OB.20]NBI08427.1 diguanylate cyclase [Colidextribacter sp. OB.20]
MSGSRKQSAPWLAVLLTVCGAVLLALVFGTLVLRYRVVEAELDRMLTESLTAHTVEAGEGAGYLLHYAETALKNTDLLIGEDPRSPEKDWVASTVEAFNLVDDRMELSYLDLEDLSSVPWGDEAPELVRQVLAGENAVSGILSAPSHEDYSVIALRPLKWDGRVMGALAAEIKAKTLLHQGTHSTFFHNVHSVVADGEGRVVYGSVPETGGLSLTILGEKNGISDKDAQAFNAAYQNNESGSFYYDPPEGRFYVAWAQVGYNGWRVVQFSQSPSVQIARSSMMQTIVMLVSLAVCALLAVLAWWQRARLVAEKLRYNALSEFKDTLLFEYDRESDSMEFTSNALETLDLDRERLKGVVTREAESFPVFHPDDMESVRRILRDAASMAPDQIEHDRVRLKRRDGEYSWYRSQYKAVFGPDGRVTRVIGTLTDISAQIDREIELRKQAQQDPLTGVYNRAGVKLINARLEQISRGVLFMLDLDDFKSINDNFGHAAGDKLLMAIGHILNETFRADDIVARVGGDEFVAFLSGSDSRALAEQKGQELLERVRNLRIEGIDAVASVSVGAASAPTYGRTFEALSVVADDALYQVKNSGKGGFALK